MEDEEKDFNNEFFDLKELPEKLTNDFQKYAIKILLGDSFGTGFFCIIYLDNNKPMPVLFTCYHVLNEDYIEKNQFLYFNFLYNGNNTKGSIDLKIKRIFYLDEDLDVTIIEIKEEDNLDIYSFFEMDNSIILNNPNILHHNVYLLHFPSGFESIQYSQGVISGLIKNVNFTTDYSTKPGSSGSPIFDYKSNLVIGMHQKAKNESKIGSGIILKYAVNKFTKVNKEEINNDYKNLFPDPDSMIMIYIYQKNKSIKLFSDKFVNRYKKNCYLIYNDKVFPLIQHFQVSDISIEDKNRGEIKIILKGINFVDKMDYMFSRCDNLKKVIATGTDMSNVTNMEAMFEWCKNLEEISNMAKWNLEKVTTLKGLFYKCVNLKKIPGINKWNPINLTNCEEMFFSCLTLLNSSERSQVEQWKNIPENKKKDYNKGCSSTNFWSYALFENLPGTIKFCYDKILPFKKKNKK